LKKVFIIVPVIAALLVSGFLGARYFELLEKREPPIRYEQVDMGEFLVNLQNEQRCYLRTQIIVEYVYDKDTAKIFSLQQAKSRDKIISVLRSKSSAELLEVDNLRNVRDQLISELEVALELDDKIVDLWFINFVIQ